jgi:T-complex protein 1 subunit theta
MMSNMRRGIPSLMKEGTKQLSGLEQVVMRNIEACKQLADITRTSYGPTGMNKMIINHLEKLFVTSDASTILRESEIAHPAAKMVVLACQMQQAEIGDGANYVICLAGQLLQEAEDLIKMGLHPSDIIAGYSKAVVKAQEIMESLSVMEIDKTQMRDVNTLAKAINSSIASKQYGVENILSPIIAEACLTVLPKNVYNFNVDNVRVAKVLGSTLDKSEVVKGMIIGYPPMGVIEKVKDANIAVFTCSLQAAESETKGTVLIQNAKELMDFSVGEEKEIELLIQSVKDSGVNVVVTGGSVDDMAKHFLDKAGIMIIKISSKFELRRLCRAVKANALVALGPVRKEDMGYCTSVGVRQMGNARVTIFNQDKMDDTSVATVLLRASTHNVLNDVNRAVDDGVNVVKAMGKFQPAKFLPGAGASDIEIARQLAAWGEKTSGLEQYSIAKFAKAFEVIPRALAENAGHDALNLISQLYASHEKGNTSVGVNVVDGQLQDAAASNIYDLHATKSTALRLATDAVITILRVDQIITAKQAGGPRTNRPQEGHWDDTDM